MNIRLLQHLRSFTIPLLIPLNLILRGNFRLLPSVILNYFEIVTSKNRKQFLTIEKILNIVSYYKLEGDIIECGIYKGSTIIGMALYAKKKRFKKTFIGLDSFQGFPEPTNNDKLNDGTIHEMSQKGYFNDTSYDYVNRKISALGLSSMIVLKEGFFEKTLPFLHNNLFCIVVLDCDLYESYRICLEYLYDRVVDGGYIIFDEYDYSENIYPGAKKAIDEFFYNKPEKIESFTDVDKKYIRYFIRKLPKKTNLS
jgi:O-methyltransferase